MCNLEGIAVRGIKEETWRAVWNKYKELPWIKASYVTRIYGVSDEIPHMQDVEDGRLSGYAEVIEGQCPFAIADAQTFNGWGPFEALVRFRVMIGETIPLNRVSRPKALHAFFFLLGPGDRHEFEENLINFATGNASTLSVPPLIDEREIKSNLEIMLSGIRRVIKTATMAIPHNLDNGGSIYDGLWASDEAHYVVYATVESHDEAMGLLQELKTVPFVRMAFVLVEVPEDASMHHHHHEDDKHLIFPRLSAKIRLKINKR